MYKQKYTRDTDGPISRDDPNYGKPQKGTWTAERGAKAHSHVHRVKNSLKQTSHSHFSSHFYISIGDFRAL